jgi:hypothetical protein
MIIQHYIAFEKTQKKMFDCWYACIQMLRSAVAGAKTKPAGQTTMAHRSRWALGRKLDFGSAEGGAILRENHLVDISPKIRFDRINSLAKELQDRGPLIAGGKYSPLNMFGHFIVISGVDTNTGSVSICDPGWGKGKETKTWDYITRHAWKMVGDDNQPSAGGFVASDTSDLVNARGRG